MQKFSVNMATNEKIEKKISHVKRPFVQPSVAWHPHDHVGGDLWASSAQIPADEIQYFLAHSLLNQMLKRWTLHPGFLDTLCSRNQNDKKVQPRQGPRVLTPYHLTGHAKSCSAQNWCANFPSNCLSNCVLPTTKYSQNMRSHF